MITKYFSPFIWDLWLSPGPALASRPPRLHVYDACTNELIETHKPPANQPTIFSDLDIGLLSVETLQALRAAEHSFAHLEAQAEGVVRQILERTVWRDGWGARRSAQRTDALPLTVRDIEALRKYFLFIRFRNSEGFEKIVQSLQDAYKKGFEDGYVLSAYGPLIVQLRLRHVLQSFMYFLEHTETGDNAYERRHGEAPIVDASLDDLHNLMDLYCWRLCKAELCIGIATEDQEFIVSDKCFGTLDEGLIENPECCDLFFPLLPTLALYLIGASIDDDPCPTSSAAPGPYSTVWIDIGLESAIDVHLRNACVLQTHVSFLYFGSLRSIALSISSYDEFRWTEEHLDYSRLKQRCRQKFLQETVTKTLVVKGSIKVVDLTDDVDIIGDSAVAHGAFSDVWMGMWEDPMDKKRKKVALKFLRQIMVNNVREKLVKRLQAEVLAWHRLCHRNVSQLFGIVQSPTSLAMVSQWCSNGTICSYIRENPSVDRLSLLTQVASGITYLHTVKPTIIHGDLKGGNILIDDAGTPIITDFGLSKVLEEISNDLPLNANMAPTSFFAGSTRWMAPELVLALVQDDDTPPPITTASDVYAFASICLEVTSGKLPYANRTNDHAVTVDILRGIRPVMDETCLLDVDCAGEAVFRDILRQCWTEDPAARPSMAQVSLLFDVLHASQVRRPA